MHSTMCKTGERKPSAWFWCQQYYLMGSIGKERQKKTPERGKKIHSINSSVKFSHAGTLLQRQQTQVSTFSAHPEPVPASPAAVPWMLLLLSQPRPLPTMPSLPWAPKELVLLHITPFHLSW